MQAHCPYGCLHTNDEKFYRFLTSTLHRIAPQHGDRIVIMYHVIHVPSLNPMYSDWLINTLTYLFLLILLYSYLLYR